MIFLWKYNKTIFDKTEINKNVTHLYFGDSYNKKIKDNILSENITHVFFGYSFNKNIDNLPDSIETLRLNHKFTEKINKWSSSLTTLIILNNEQYNFPDTVKKLILGDYFNQNIDNLPCLLEELQIYNCDFNKKVLNLPSNLHKIVLANDVYFEGNVSAFEIRNLIFPKIPFSCEFQILNLAYKKFVHS